MGILKSTLIIVAAFFVSGWQSMEFALVDDIDEMTDERRLQFNYIVPSGGFGEHGFVLYCGDGQAVFGAKSGAIFYIKDSIDVLLRFDQNPAKTITMRWSDNLAMRLRAEDILGDIRFAAADSRAPDVEVHVAAHAGDRDEHVAAERACRYIHQESDRVPRARREVECRRRELK